MSGSTRQRVGIRIDAEGADEARRKIEAFGRSGKDALDRVNTAATASSPALQNAARAADVASRSFFAMGGSLGALGNTFTAVASVGSGLTATFAAVAAGAIAASTAIARAGDAANATLARLGATTGSGDTARNVYERLFALSQQTGVAVGESAAAFNRFKVAAGEIGATNDQVLRLVAGLQKAGVVGGYSANEISAATTQLSQALASGVLQGEELKSIIENMPTLAQAIARELGVSVGELRKMGEEGKLIADRILPAAIAGAERLGAEFDKMPRTMSTSWDILGSAATNFLAKLNQILAVSEKAGAVFRLWAWQFNLASGAVAGGGDSAAALRARLEDMRSAAAPSRDQFPDGLAGDRLFAAARANVDPRQAQQVADMERRYAIAAQREADAALYADPEAAGFDQRPGATAYAAGRQRGRVMYDKAIAGVDDAAKALQNFKKAMAEYEEIQRLGGATEEELGRLRAGIQREYQEALDKTRGKLEAEKKVTGELADAHVKAYEEAQKASEKAAEASKRAAERFQESSINAVARTMETAADRLGDALVNAFVSGSGAAVNFGNIARGIVGSIASDLVKLAVVNPLRNALFSSASPAPTLGGAGGFDLGSVFNLSSLIPKDGILSSLGLGGGSLGSLGSLLGPAGLMFGAGSLIGGLVAGNSPERNRNSMIGAGLGTALGLVAGGPIGAIAGGIIGGLIGPNASVKGYGYRVTGTGAGGLAPLDYTYFNESGKAQFQEAEQAIAAINAYVKQRGLTIGGSYIVGGNKDGPDYSHADSGSFNEAFGKLYFGASNDNRLNAALEGRKFGDPSALQSFTETYFQIRDLTETPAQRLARQLEEVNRQFDELTAKAKEYGFAESDLAMARQRAIDQISGADRATARGLLANLTFGGASALAPEQQYFAALSTLNVARRDLAAGGSLAEYAGVAQAVLPVARQFLGTSTRYAQLAAEVAATVAAQGGDPAGLAGLLGGVATGTSALEATFASYGERSLSVQSATLAEIRRLADTLTALIARQRAA